MTAKTQQLERSPARVWVRLSYRVEIRGVLAAAGRCSVLGGLLICAVSFAGCATFQKQPVAQNVAAAREMSYRGMDAMQREEWDAAETLFRKAIEKCPTDERAHCHYAELLSRRGELLEAIRHMDEAVRLSGGDPKLLVELGELQLEQGDVAAATQSAERAIRANGSLAAAWSLQGDIHRRRGQRDDALASYHRALAYESVLPQVQIAVAEIYRESGRPRRTLATLEALAASYPPGQIPQDVLVRKGLALKQLERFDEAIETLAAASQQGPPSAELLFELSDAHWRLGDRANAVLAARGALARDPGHVASRQLLTTIDQEQSALTASLRQ